MFEIVYDWQDNTACLELGSITTTAGYSQMINKPTHVINQSSSCINLIFSSDTSFVNCGSEPSINEKYLHNIWCFAWFGTICTI